MSGDSARISALGANNYTAKNDDAHSFLVNPAGLAKKKGTQIMTTYEDRFAGDLRKGMTSFSIRNFALTVDYLTVPGIEGRDDTGQKTGELDYNELAASGAMGFTLSSAITSGIGLNYMSKQAAGDKSTLFTCKAGTIYRPHKILSLGLVLDNVGFQSSFSKSKRMYAPFSMRAGACLMPAKGLSILGGGSFFSQQGAILTTGAEYIAFDHVMLRVGIDFGHESYGIVTGGIGISFGDLLQLDYSLRGHEALGLTNVITFTCKLKYEPAQKPRVITEFIKEIKIIKEVEIREKIVEKEKIVKVEVEKRVEVEKIVYEVIKEYVPVAEIKDRKLEVNAGLFDMGECSDSEMTEEGREYAKKAANLISYLTSVGLLPKDAKIVIEGNACPKGSYKYNERLAFERALCGLALLIDVLGKENVEGKYDIVIRGDRVAKDIEAQYIEKWRDDHNDEEPSTKQLEEFRKNMRNFKFLINVDYGKWKDFKGDAEVRARIEEVCPGLPTQIDKECEIRSGN